MDTKHYNLNSILSEEVTKSDIIALHFNEDPDIADSEIHFDTKYAAKCALNTETVVFLRSVAIKEGFLWNHITVTDCIVTNDNADITIRNTIGVVNESYMEELNNLSPKMAGFRIFNVPIGD